MFSNLSDSLDQTFRNLRGVGKISEKNIQDALKDVRLALLEADVELGVVKKFIAEVSREAQGEKVLKSVKPGEQIVKIFQDQLTELLGGNQEPINLEKPGYVLMCGLNGAGKTTTSAKLALRLKKGGEHKPLLIACDLYRPAAVEQLAKLGEQIDVPVFRPHVNDRDLVKVAKNALKWAQEQDGNVLIFDTAGRQELDTELLDELKALHEFLTPGETLLVADSATGQQAVSVAQTFDEAVGITGLVLTKLDGDARGGAALSMRSVTGKPIKYVGEGEKMEDLHEFHPDRMADRILGMGDVVTMVEDVADKIDEAKAMRAAERLQKGQFDFNDFLDQMKMIQSLGPLEGLLGMLPGFSKIKKSLPAGALDSNRIKHMEAIVLSMTPEERKRPNILRPPRRRRIAAGSGRTVIEVNQLLKQFGQMQKMMKGKGKMQKMMQQMGGLTGGGGGMPDLGALGGSAKDGPGKKGGLGSISDLLGGGGKGGPKFPF